MRARFGRHGGICFLLDAEGAITAISDSRHARDPVPFHEAAPPHAGTADCLTTKGHAWAGQLGLATLEPDISRALDRLGLPYRSDPAAFEMERKVSEGIEKRLREEIHGDPPSRHQRDLLYQELDGADAAAALKLDFALQRPYRWEVQCPGLLAAAGGGYLLPGGLRLWISSEYPVRQDRDLLQIDLPPGQHVVVLVVRGGFSGLEIDSTAVLLRPDDAAAAAVAYLACPTRFAVVIPVASDAEMDEAGRLLADLGIGRALVVDGLAGSADQLGLRPEAIVTINTAQHDWHRVVAETLSPGSPPLEIVGDPALAVYEGLSSGASSSGLVVCDSRQPCVRVIAAAYAAHGGYALELLDVDEAPVSPPDWSAVHPEPLEIRIERYRVELTTQVERLIAPRLPVEPPKRAVAFTRGYAYSLLAARNGRWADQVETGILPDSQAPALLLRSLARYSSPVPRFGTSLIVDAFGSPGSRFDTIRTAAAATAARPVGVRGVDATKEIVASAASGLPAELVMLTCHGEADFLELADARLTAAEVATWRLRRTPVVVNNSCGSLHTTGAAFVTAGARVYVGTLWPVRAEAAGTLCATLIKELTSAAEIPVGGALRQAIDASGALDYDDRNAYVLVGLPEVPARLAPLIDDRQRREIAEHGLPIVHGLATQLIRTDMLAAASFVHERVAGVLADDLRAHADRDPSASFELHNLVTGGQLSALLANYDASYWRALGARGLATTGDVIASHQRALSAWEDAFVGDASLSAARNRLQSVSEHLAAITALLVWAGRYEDGWHTGLKTAAVLADPLRPAPDSPPEIDDDTLIAQAAKLQRPADFLNAVALCAAHTGRHAERIYVGALWHARDPGEEGRIRSNLAALHRAAGRIDEAQAGLEAALPLLRAADDKRSVGITLTELALLRLDQGDPTAAERMARELADSLVPEPGGAWWDADLALIKILYATRQYGEAAAHARRRHRIACDTRNTEQAWQELGLYVELGLRAAATGADHTLGTGVLDATAWTLQMFAPAPPALRDQLVRSISIHRIPLARALGTRMDLLMDVLTGLRSTETTAAQRNDLLSRARSAQPHVFEAGSKPWVRECHVRIIGDRALSVIYDIPPDTFTPPAYIRYPTREHNTPTDAFVEDVECWTRVPGEIAYRYDGSPGAIFIDKAKLIRRTGRNQRYRDVWGSRRFLYLVMVTFPEGSVLTGAEVRPHTGSQAPDLRIGRSGNSPVLSIRPSAGLHGRPWLATVTVWFENSR
ncbi:CHAT domain-containing protein [Catellatospora citrea]|uniref:CHAT domain-containing protein n=1 Tax=Catellatospora citrea TaxID=53366 RepID=UPI0033D7333A